MSSRKRDNGATAVAEPVEAVTGWADAWRRERNAGTPLVAMATPDVHETSRALARLCDDSQACLIWSCSAGLAAANEAGKEAAQKVCDAVGVADPRGLAGMSDLLVGAQALPDGGMLVCLNAHMHWSGPMARDAAMALRDPFKRTSRTLVLLAPDVGEMPRELATDVRVLRELLPTSAQRKAIISSIYDDACSENKLPELEAGDLSKAVDATAGLTGFMVEQGTAVAIRKTGLDLADLRVTAREAINARKGLRVSDERVTWKDVGGLGALSGYIDALAAGPDRFSAVVLWDEIEKMLAGSGGGDLSGVSADILGAILTWIERRRVHCVLLMGPPGAGKSLSAQAAAGQHNVPLIWMDIGAMKGSLVGESGANVRGGLDTIDAVSGGKVLVIATCNGTQELKPELQRRFKPRFVVDMPGADELDAIWKIQLAAHDLAASAPRPTAEGWTGAEVRDACRIARATRTDPLQASRYVVPISVSAAGVISRVRQEAVGRFICAARGGPYKGPTESAVVQEKGRRKLAVEQDK